jgi:hypothetical protein
MKRRKIIEAAIKGDVAALVAAATESEPIAPGIKVWSRSGETVGKTTGKTHRCRLEDCPGDRIAVRWPDGKITFPCSEGMTLYKGGLKIK